MCVLIKCACVLCPGVGVHESVGVCVPCAGYNSVWPYMGCVYLLVQLDGVELMVGGCVPTGRVPVPRGFCQNFQKKIVNCQRIIIMHFLVCYRTSWLVFGQSGLISVDFMIVDY